MLPQQVRQLLQLAVWQLLVLSAIAANPAAAQLEPVEAAGVSVVSVEPVGGLVSAEPLVCWASDWPED